MAGFADYEAYDALGLADLVRRRQVTPDRAARRRHRAGRGAEPDGQCHRAPALRLRSKGDRRRSAGRSIPWRPVPPEGPDGLAGRGPDDARLALLRGDAARGRRQRARGPAQARRSGRLRANEHVRARALAHLRAPALRPDEEPVGSDPHLGRLERRRGRGHGRAHRPDGPRERRLRVDPGAGGLLRPGGPQADPRAEHDGAVHRRGAGRPLHRARRDADRARLRRAPRRHGGSWRRRSLRRAAARPAVPRRGGRPAGSPPDRLDRSRAERRPRGSRVRGARPGDRSAVRRPRSRGDRGGSGHRAGRGGPDLPDDRRRQLGGQRPDAPDGRPPTPSRRGRERDLRHRGARRAGHGPGVRPGHADRPPPRPADGGLPSAARCPADAGAGDAGRGQAGVDRHDAGGRGRVLAARIYVLAIHGLVQYHRSAGHHAPAEPDRYRQRAARAAACHPAREPLRRRGNPLPAGIAARGRAPLV